MDFLDVRLQVVPASTGVAAQVTHEGLDVVVFVHVVTQALGVRVLLPTLATLERLLPCVAPTVAPQTA